MTRQEALQAAVEAAGTKTALAKALGVTPQAVNQWRVVPTRHILAVERIFGISRHDQNPDIYPK